MKSHGGGCRWRLAVNGGPDGATSESPALTEIDNACADHDAAAASAALPGVVATAAPQAATAATADPSKRQVTVAESFQRVTRRRTDDPGNADRPPSDAPPLITATPSDPDPSPHLSPHRSLSCNDHADDRPYTRTRRTH